MTLWAAPMVRLPPAPISRVWSVLLIVIAAADVRDAGELQRRTATLFAIVNVWPLATVPVRFSTPPVAVIAPPAHSRIFAATVPDPIRSTPPLPIDRPDASGQQCRH